MDAHTPHKIEAVIFDIGHVLVDWLPEQFYDQALGVAQRKALFQAVDLYGMNERLDLGEDFEAVVTAEAKKHPEFADQIMMWFTHCKDFTAGGFEHSVRLLRALKARGIPVFALSNFGDGAFDIALAKFPFLAEFDRAYISGKLGLIKPDPEFYAYVENDCAIAPQGLLFIDDRLNNIQAAARRLWQTHHFTHASELAQALVRSGLLTESEAR